MSRYVVLKDVARMALSMFGITTTEWLQPLRGLPSIDICFCRECKYCSKDRIKWSIKDEDGNWIDTKCNLCRRTKLEVSLDDFCSYGVHNSSEKPNNSERSSE